MSNAELLRPDGTRRLRGVEVDPVRGGFRSLFPDLPTRFWSHVERGEGCWLWTGHRSKDGYGVFQLRPRVPGRAHRVSWYLNFGEIPVGSVIRHTCHNPPCVRPDHLRVGTQKENVEDELDRGTFPRGSRHGMARLTEADVLEIRRLAVDGETYRTIATRFGVSHHTVGVIVRRQAWARVGGIARNDGADFETKTKGGAS